MDCKLQVFKRDPVDSRVGKTYRFAVLDFSKSKEYPANFVCMLPIKVDQSNKKSVNVFGEIFGEKSLVFAIELLNKALKSEKDDEVRSEIERRIKLIDPEQAKLVQCSVCKKTFQPVRYRKHKQNLCDTCVKTRYKQKYTHNV
jgi:hypothetical protein